MHILILLLSVSLAVPMCWVLTALRRGITTIFWGTGGVTSGTLNTAIVEEATWRPIKSRGTIQEGQGFTVSTADIPDGEEATVRCVFDTAIAWPNEGDVVTLTKPGGTPTKFEVVEIEQVATRKKEGSLTLKCERYVGITLP